MSNQPDMGTIMEALEQFDIEDLGINITNDTVTLTGKGANVEVVQQAYEKLQEMYDGEPYNLSCEMTDDEDEEEDENEEECEEDEDESEEDENESEEDENENESEEDENESEEDENESEEDENESEEENEDESEEDEDENEEECEEDEDESEEEEESGFNVDRDALYDALSNLDIEGLVIDVADDNSVTLTGRATADVIGEAGDIANSFEGVAAVNNDMEFIEE